MNEEIKDLIEQLNVCSVNDYNFEIYGNEAKILNEYIKELEQENKQLKEKLKIKHEGFMACVKERCEEAEQLGLYKSVIDEVRKRIWELKVYENNAIFSFALTEFGKDLLEILDKAKEGKKE